MAKETKKSSVPKRGCKSTIKHVGDELRIHEKCVIPKEALEVSAPSKAKAETKEPSSHKQYLGVKMGGKKEKIFAKDACKDSETGKMKKFCVERAVDAWKEMTSDERKEIMKTIVKEPSKPQPKYDIENKMYDIG